MIRSVLDFVKWSHERQSGPTINGDGMFGWFKKTKKEPVQIGSELSAKLSPQPGEIWCFDDGSPWPTDMQVKILSVNNGWVRYYMSPFFRDERKEIRFFIKMYRKTY